METKGRVLDGYVEESVFAADNNTTQRTVARYRNQPNGIPFLKWAGKTYIHVDGAREYVKARTKRNNPTKRKA